eukprot:2452953-Alexandrium_andersonii.AAC.1
MDCSSGLGVFLRSRDDVPCAQVFGMSEGERPSFRVFGPNEKLDPQDMGQSLGVKKHLARGPSLFIPTAAVHCAIAADSPRQWCYPDESFNGFAGSISSRVHAHTCGQGITVKENIARVPARLANRAAPNVRRFKAALCCFKRFQPPAEKRFKPLKIALNRLKTAEDCRPKLRNSVPCVSCLTVDSARSKLSPLQFSPSFVQGVQVSGGARDLSTQVSAVCSSSAAAAIAAATAAGAALGGWVTG